MMNGMIDMIFVLLSIWMYVIDGAVTNIVGQGISVRGETMISSTQHHKFCGFFSITCLYIAIMRQTTLHTSYDSFLLHFARVSLSAG